MTRMKDARKARAISLADTNSLFISSQFTKSVVIPVDTTTVMAIAINQKAYTRFRPCFQTFLRALAQCGYFNPCGEGRGFNSID